MDVAALSQQMAQQNLAQQVDTQVKNLAMEAEETSGENMVDMIEEVGEGAQQEMQSMEPHKGSNLDMLA
ncbi:YjfB family protein [Natranaerofaba carboxydovora]|uniref:YjfB family protein n=1 Tax=Natranaerofaba carboxydovora TaxID=2742683 RepID=UPI001F1330AD|nr:YjfB family protein [Natranaerofaba carboxydovora]UMZ72783.1 Putative motility protein [Natranaerofaba carboxydovora]